MQIYNWLRHFLRYSLLCVGVFFVHSPMYMQSLQAPSIKSPTAPTVTGPTVVAPIAPTAPVLQASPSIPSQTTRSTTSSSTNSRSSPEGARISSDLTASALQTISAFIGGDTGDSELGDLGSLSSLGNLSSLTGGIQNAENSASTNMLLAEILEKLDILLARLTDDTAIKNTVGKQTISQNDSRILRFTSTVPGGANQIYDILNTCRTVFISEPEPDGSFLLTCDRVYSADGVPQNETFYMLFKAVERDSFTVAVSVQQDLENKNSLLYRLSEYSPFVADRTGNLVTVRTKSPVPQIDLLLDIDFQTN